MSQLTLPLPKTLHNELEVLADNEGVPLNEYILYILSRQVAQAYTVQVTPKEALEMQETGFKSLLGKWGKASPAAVDDTCPLYLSGWGTEYIGKLENGTVKRKAMGNSLNGGEIIWRY